MMIRPTPGVSGAVLVTLALLASCRGQPDSVRSGASESTDSVPAPAEPAAAETAPAAPQASVDSSEWTIGVLTQPSTVSSGPVPVLTGLRTGTHAEYVRFTVELEAPAGLPGFRLEYVDRPLRECGSGNQVFPVGDAWLELRLEPAAAHTEAGEATLGAKELVVGGPLLQRVYRTCDFEGVVVHVLALTTPNPFRTLTLSGPPRIVVDVRH